MGVKVIGKETFKGWEWGDWDFQRHLVKMQEVSCKQGAKVLLEQMTAENALFMLDCTDEGLCARFCPDLENLVIVGKLELPDENWDIEDIEETLAGLRKAADDVQETLEKAKARIAAWEEKVKAFQAEPPLTPEERRASIAANLKRLNARY